MCGKYPEFGATLAAEKLGECEGNLVSREAMRRIRINMGLAPARWWRSVRVKSPRDRRPRFGELIPISVSPHDWFEGRGPRCTPGRQRQQMPIGRLYELTFSPKAFR